MAMAGTDDERGQRRTALVSIAAAAALVALKLGAGLATNSLGLVSAGIESSGDVIAAILTFAAIRLGTRPADEGHPFGHRRAENLAAIGEAAILVAGATFVLVEAIGQLREGGHVPDAGWTVVLVLALAAIVDVTRTIASIRSARRYHSAALRSNAFHFASDLGGTAAVAIGLLLVHEGLHWGDRAAALVVAALILGAAGRLISENASVLMDRSPAEAREAARGAIEALGADLELRRLRVRESGGRYFADAVVAVAPGVPVSRSHALADDVESAIHRALPDSDVVVHVEPQRHGDLRDRVLAAALANPAVREAHDVTIFASPAGALVSLHLKMPADLSLAEAHEIAEQIEDELRADPEVAEVHTHLEPLERPSAVDPGASADVDVRRRIAALVAARTGRPPRELHLLPTEEGLVVFVTVRTSGDVSLTEAHTLAGRLEDDIRAGRSGIAEVVVHTEPDQPT
jgi:cation diffusion facilitator family transporter